MKKHITISLSCFLLLNALYCNGQSFIGTNILWNNIPLRTIELPNIYNIQFEKKLKRRYHKVKIGFARPIDREINTRIIDSQVSYRERIKLMMLQHQFAIKNQNTTKGIMIYGLNNIYYKIRNKDWDNMPNDYSSGDRAILLGTGIQFENNIKFTKRIVLTTGIQAQIDWLIIGKSYSEHPSLTFEQQRSNEFEIILGPNIALTMGIKILLSTEF